MERAVTRVLLAEVYGTFLLTFLGGTSITIVTNYGNLFGALGAVSGASLNPARSFAPALVSLIFSTTPISWYWVYAVGPVIGALVARTVYKVIFKPPPRRTVRLSILRASVSIFIERDA